MNAATGFCRFETTARSGIYRCGRCGFVMPHPSPHPPERVYRNCAVIRMGDGPVPRVSAATKAWNLARAVGSFAADGFETVSAPDYEARLRVCDRCPHRYGNRCSLCGCGLTKKARARAWHCPLALWPGDDEPDRAAVELVRQRHVQRPSLLLAFPHGFGDAVQLTTVLAHLRRFHPDWDVDVAVKRGADSLFTGLARRTIPLEESNADGYTIARVLDFPEPTDCLEGCPSTKAEWCLKRTFGIEPIEALCRYEIQIGADDLPRARSYLEEVIAVHDGRPRQASMADRRFPVVLLHYQGNSARRRKNLDERTVASIVAVVKRRGLVPIVLDWETPFRSKLIDQRTVFCPDADRALWRGRRTGDGAAMAALIEQATFFVGIDSGPLHVAAATTTPSLGVWTKHHPIHYFGLADNVLHVVPRDHQRHVRGPHCSVGLDYFRCKYRYHVCTRHFRDELPEVFDEALLSSLDDAARRRCPR